MALGRSPAMLVAASETPPRVIQQPCWQGHATAAAPRLPLQANAPRRACEPGQRLVSDGRRLSLRQRGLRRIALAACVTYLQAEIKSAQPVFTAGTPVSDEQSVTLQCRGSCPERRYRSLAPTIRLS